MFHSGHWAAALLNTLEREGGEVEDGIKFFKVLASWVKKLSGDVSGSSAAEKLGKIIRDGITKRGDVLSIAQETALRTFLLMVQKNTIQHIDSVIEKIKELMDRKHGIIAVSVEYANSEGNLSSSDKSRIKEEIKKRTSAASVDLTERINAGLIGGYRLRIGDEIIDASVCSQLRKLSDHLSAWSD